jgi:hypothetical protein
MYHIIHRNSGKPLVISGSSTAYGARAVQESGALPWAISTCPAAYIP